MIHQLNFMVDNASQVQYSLGRSKREVLIENLLNIASVLLYGWMALILLIGVAAQLKSSREDSTKEDRKPKS
jgi:hypothetical protein